MIMTQIRFIHFIWNSYLSQPFSIFSFYHACNLTTRYSIVIALFHLRLSNFFYSSQKNPHILNYNFFHSNLQTWFLRNHWMFHVKHLNFLKLNINLKCFFYQILSLIATFYIIIYKTNWLTKIIFHTQISIEDRSKSFFYIPRHISAINNIRRFSHTLPPLILNHLNI